MVFKRLAWLTLAIQASLPAAAGAQTATPPVAGWQDGFFLQSPNGDYRLVLGMVAQADGRFAVGDPLPMTNTFTIRKIRPTFSGRLAKYFDFKVMPDFGSGAAVMADAYLDARFSPKFRVRMGKDKAPVGYELLQGDAFLLFPERALASSLVPNRDIGVQAQGDLSPKLFYAVGVFNGIPDGASSTTEIDADSDKDVAGRIAVQPFRSATTPAAPLSGLGFQVGASRGDQSGALPSFKTSVGQTYFSYATGATAGGGRDRISPAVFYYYGSLGVFAEYMRSTQAVARAAVTRDITNHAWEVTGSYVLTGEAASDRGVKPTHTFDPQNGHWGALQLLARYTSLTVDPDAFLSGLAAAGASRQAQSYTLAVNWYPAASIKYYATVERTSFDHNADGARPTEHVVLIRAQIGF